MVPGSSRLHAWSSSLVAGLDVQRRVPGSPARKVFEHQAGDGLRTSLREVKAFRLGPGRHGRRCGGLQVLLRRQRLCGVALSAYAGAQLDDNARPGSGSALGERIRDGGCCQIRHQGHVRKRQYLPAGGGSVRHLTQLKNSIIQRTSAAMVTCCCLLVSVSAGLPVSNSFTGSVRQAATYAQERIEAELFSVLVW